MEAGAAASMRGKYVNVSKRSGMSFGQLLPSFFSVLWGSDLYEN